MATLAFDRPRDEVASDHRFAATMAIVMALVVAAGFSTQLAMGRSTFASPLRVHFHAVAFMGWVALFRCPTGIALVLGLGHDDATVSALYDKVKAARCLKPGEKPTEFAE